MIYRICINNEDIYGTDLDNSVLNPSLEIELNSAGSLNFTLPPEHRQWDAPNVFVDEVDVYEDNEIIWFGRPLQVTRDWNNQKKVVCEGALAYFNDSVQRPKEYKLKNTTLSQFFEDIIDMHNQQVASNRKIFPGNFTVDDVPVYRKVDYETTAECLQRYCLDTDGGYFILRKERNPEDPSEWIRYIDWVADLQGRSDQPVQFGLNMLDIAQDLNGADICTVLIPTGGDDLLVNNVATQTVNGCSHVKGEDEIVFVGENDPSNPEGIHKYGRVLKQKDWSDIYDKDQLFQKACEWLVEQNTDIPTIECAAADLHYLPEYEDQYGSDTAKFRVGQKVRVISSIHGIGSDYVLPMFKISMNLDSGVKRITIGTPPKRELTDIIAPGTSGGSTRSSGSSSGSGGGSGGGSTYVPVVDVLTKVPGSEVYKSVVTKKKAKIDLSELGGGNVVDVTVDGNSVVDPEDNIAKITMPIIPTAPVQDVQVDNQSIVDQNGIANLDSSDFGTTVVANPSDTATDDLTKVQIGNTVYDIPGGGGTTVVANPSGTATDDLEKVQIGNTIYDIPGSGGSGGRFRQELIYDTPVSAAGNITVSNFGDADSLTFVIGIYASGSYQTFFNEVPMTDFKAGNIAFVGGTLTQSSGTTWSKYAAVKYINDTTISVVDIDGHYWGETGYIYRIYKNIYGATNCPVYMSDIYSEEEQLVGVYSDGKPLYQKTDHVTLTNPMSAQTETTIQLSTIQNLDKIFYKSVIGGFYGTAQTISSWTCFSEDTNATSASAATVRTYYNDTIIVWAGSNHDNFPSVSTDNRYREFYITRQYTKTTDTAGVGCPAPGNIISLPAIYSEKERQVGVWTDGRPLYQKTIVSPVLTVNQDNLIYTFSNTDEIKDIEAIYSILEGDSTNTYVGQNYYTSDHDVHNVYIYHNGIYCAIYDTIANRTHRVFATIQYTKTTDQQGSAFPNRSWPVTDVLVNGKSTLDGTIAKFDNGVFYLSDIYSTTEKRVGYWKDGKPLYQVTQHYSSVTKGTTNTISHGIQNVDTIFCIDANCKYDGRDEVLSLPYISTNSNYHITFSNITNTSFMIAPGSGFNSVEDLEVTFQYTKTTDTAEPNPVLGNVISLPSIYSEEERQIGVDTDGRPLYQRTYKISVDHTSTASYYLQSYAHGISNLNLDSVRFEASIIANSGTVRPLVFNYGTDDYGSAVWNGNVFADSTYILFELGRQIRANTDRIVVTLRYTKTTDTPGSGTWAPDGTQARHYSLNEHIVGTWIDGSTIYEKTWDLGEVNFPNNSWTAILNNLDIGRIVSHEGLQDSNASVCFDVWLDGTTLKAKSLRTENEYLRYLTLRYTKSS